ncbi:MAG: peptidase S8, partial [Flavobacterium sp.]|nr:peptidase S8 [Flavobacterium sp.]
MKKLLLFLIILSSFQSFSQDEDAVIYFKDKPNSANFLANPLTMLTQRALDRRTNQNIALDIKDVPIHQPYYDQLNATSGFVILAKSKWLNCVYVRGTIANIQALIGLSFVDNVKFLDNTLNFTNNLPISNSVSKLKKVNKAALMNTTYNYGNSFNQIHMMNGEILHQQNFTGSGKIIAVLDSGFPGVNTTQPFQRLITNNQILGGYDFVNKSNNYFSGHFHGTWVLSCMGGYVDSQLIGTAPDAQFYLFITE